MVGAAILVVSAGILVDGWIGRIPAVPAPGAPPAVHVLSGGTVLEIPVGPARDAAAQFRAVTGGWRVVNGYSGYAPAYYAAITHAVRAEEDGAVAPFRALGDLDVIVPEDAPRLVALIERQAGVITVARARGWVQYRLPHSPAAAARIGARLPIRGVRASCLSSTAPYVADGDESTRWHCPQEPGREITIDLGGEFAVGGITHSLADYVGDFPRHLVVETSLDGDAWTSGWDGSVTGLVIAQAIEAPGPTIRFAVPLEPRAARYVRLRQTGRDPEATWSIAELEVWK